MTSLSQNSKRRVYRRVAFLKVHKAGSSTAQNIFLRYGESHNLTFLLSRVRKHHWDNVIGVATTLNEDNTLPPPDNSTYDIMCCHVLYDNEAFRKYMPADTAYIGIVREPFEQFLSTLNYFNLPGAIRRLPVVKNKEIGVEKAILSYMNNSKAYERGISPRYSMYNNRMAVEFGFPLGLFETYSKLDSHAYLKKLDKEFQFVIIMEYFVESVVMMRRILGWEIKDVLFLKKNAAQRSYSFVGQNHRPLYENMAKLDYDLYDHFFKRLWSQIDKEGPDFYEELLYFSRLRKEVEDFCLSRKAQSKTYHVNVSRWSEAFKVTFSDCSFLKMQEMTFIERIRKRQYG